ncbi:BlaI/MecI/CopY family transcriptional regulator [Pseudonocardia sp. C8]|uniref:BlaI/MecI/CopY family transcriptional regulator n=1 Tax=Pseudonocardia sp. C8 TaxID=2762759 RepID=UPI001642A23E|nr:BlaI/MecI/CopY family transcriptional regulator [Pseudonocardia sp. C8]
MPGLGELESRVMAALWDAHGPQTVRAVHTALSGERSLAYTTVMTVLDNLHGKGWVHRYREGRAWAYVPARAREEAGAEMLREILDSLGDPQGVLLHFARGMDERESEFLRRALSEEEAE